MGQSSECQRSLHPCIEPHHGRPKSRSQEGSSRKWKDGSLEDKQEWYRLHRIIHHERIAAVIRFPKYNVVRMVDTDEAATKKAKVTFLVWSGYAFTLTYNTDLGLEDADVIKLFQSGKAGEDLYNEIKHLPIYTEAVDSLWEHATTLARSKHSCHRERWA